jgi:predicted TIM-barrel fold metal-dependent hydrolase
VPPSFDGDRNDLAVAAARDYPDRFRVQGRFRLDVEGARDEILAAMQDPHLLGLRITFNAKAANWLLDGTIDWLWPFVAEHRIPVSLFPWAADARGDDGQLAKIGRIAGEYPDARLAIDHFGVPLWVGPHDVDDSVALITAELARYPNVALKVSALPTILREYTVDRVRPLMWRLVDGFGPSRLFWIRPHAEPVLL